MNAHELLAKARKQALLSRKPNTKVGALLVDKKSNIILSASNDYIQPLYDNCDMESKADRDLYSEHAERRIIYSAVKSGVHDFHEKTLVVTHFPCCDCARAIILIGIKSIIVGDQHMDGDFIKKWKNNLEVSQRMLEYNKVNIQFG